MNKVAMQPPFFSIWRGGDALERYGPAVANSRYCRDTYQFQKSYINYPLGRACLLPGCDPAQQLASAMWASGPEMKFDRLIGGWIDEGRQAVLAVRGSARIGQTIRSGLSSRSENGFVSVRA